MLVFDARKILTLDRVRFSDGNMQSSATQDDHSEQFFSGIDWNSGFHDSATHDRIIRVRRSAEVLAPSPLRVSDSIQWVICRSQAERGMLLYQLGSHAERWNKLIRVSDDMRVFEKRYSYVDHVAFQEDGVVFSLHPRRDGQPISLRLLVWDEDNANIIALTKHTMEPVPPGKSGWITRRSLKPGCYRVRIELEGCCAYDARLQLDEALF